MPLFSFNPTMTIKKAIIIGTLCAIGATLTTCAINHSIKHKDISATNADVLETLENTTWYFNETINKDITERTTFLINFKYITAETNYIKLIVEPSPSIGYIDGINPARPAYYGNKWANENYRTITITSGTSVNDINLINWLKKNATKVELTTLKNTTWQLKENIETIPAGLAKFNFTMHCNGYTYASLELGYATAVQTQANTIRYAGTIIYENGVYLNHSRQHRYIIIEDGTDVQNKQAIGWLTKNAINYNTFASLTNTKWTFIQNPYFEGQMNLSLEFTSNKQTFLNIKTDTNNTYIDYTQYNGINKPTEDVRVYTNNMWSREAYKTIIVSGGNSAESFATQSRLISNATGIEFTPIPTGTTGYDIEDGNFASLQSLMLKILTMPFTFISQAFNVTLWPNTPWEFNISNFILAIIAIGAVLFIIKVFTSGFSVIGNYNSSRNQNKLTKSQIETNKSRAELNKAKTEKIKKETK